ncbi:unnamed protein product, partial [Ectocarpus fasciculatus]
LQAGAYTKYSLTWVLFSTCAIGLVLQGMAARVGIVTGKHLAQLCRQEYSPPKWISLWIMSEISIIASDVQAVTTSAIALKILFKIPLWLGCILTALDALTFLSIHLLGEWSLLIGHCIQSLELFFVMIVAAMSVCFFWTFSMNLPDPVEALKGTFVPYLPSYGLHTAVGVVGSLILPQNYYVHSAVVLSRDVDRTSPREVREANKYLFVDAGVALGIAGLINFAVISTFAEQFFHEDCATLGLVYTPALCCARVLFILPPLPPRLTLSPYRPAPPQPASLRTPTTSTTTTASASRCPHTTVISSRRILPLPSANNGAAGFCQHIGLSDADAPLRASLGPTAGLIWALGLLASGQSSTMTITYAGQFINEGFGNFHLPLYQRISICRLVALIPAVLAALFEATHPSSMDDATQIGNIIASICVPFSILPMLKFCVSSRLMGIHAVGSATVALVLLVTAFLISMNAMLFYETLMAIE